MPVFSTQLGKLEGMTDNERIIANHIRKIQEELEYRLYNLDSANINEIDADETSILSGGKNIKNVIEDAVGNSSSLEQTVQGFNQTVQAYNQQYSQLTQTVDGFRQTVQGYEGQVSDFAQTVQGFQGKVQEYEGKYSEWTQTAIGFDTTVKGYEEKYSQWIQTVEGFNNTVSGYEGKYSEWLQTVEGYQSTVKGYEDQYSAMKQTVQGFATTVQGYEGKYSEMIQTVDGFQTTVQGYSSEYSRLVQTVNGMSLSVSNGSESSTISLVQNGVAISSKTITLSGMVTFTDLSRSGGTTINGSNITTGSINANLITSGSINANLITTGALSSNYIRLYDSMAVYSGNSIAGYIGYTASANDGSAGVHLKKGLGEVVATANGAKLTYNGTSNQVAVSSGGVGCTANGTYYYFGQAQFYTVGGSILGNANNLWGQIYSSNATISTSDANMKHSIEGLPAKYLDLFDRLRPVRFKLNDGTSDRYHVGFISQEVGAAMEDVGVESLEFGGFVKDRDEYGNDIFFLRYEEFIGMMAAKMQDMDKRLKRLEVSA